MASLPRSEAGLSGELTGVASLGAIGGGLHALPAFTVGGISTTAVVPIVVAAAVIGTLLILRREFELGLPRPRPLLARMVPVGVRFEKRSRVRRLVARTRSASVRSASPQIAFAATGPAADRRRRAGAPLPELARAA